MQQSHSDTYRRAGVDLAAGYEAVRRMQSHVARTNIPGVLGGLGGFGGLFQPDISGIDQPVLVSGADGVGTKLRLAFLLDKHDTVGIDCVAMCVNDILCSGAAPLFFLDYIACDKNLPERIESIVAGVAEGCVQAGCALLGGETAEMPGFYPPGEYDLAGFAVGMVEKENILRKEDMQAGDLLLALPSSGVHSNGFSLVRQVFGFEKNPSILGGYTQQLGRTLGEALLEPTCIYVQPVLALLQQVAVHGLCHITGGGFYENIPRMLPAQLDAQLDLSALPVPPIFDLIAQVGQIPLRDMRNTFNMGAGMVAAVPKEQAARGLEILQDAGVKACVLGELVPGSGTVRL